MDRSLRMDPMHEPHPFSDRDGSVNKSLFAGILLDTTAQQTGGSPLSIGPGMTQEPWDGQAMLRQFDRSGFFSPERTGAPRVIFTGQALPNHIKIASTS